MQELKYFRRRPFVPCGNNTAQGKNLTDHELQDEQSLESSGRPRQIITDDRDAIYAAYCENIKAKAVLEAICSAMSPPRTVSKQVLLCKDNVSCNNQEVTLRL
eukprot:scaffold137822_cov32-Prasinocladus_malaysianus.AAC.3